MPDALAIDAVVIGPRARSDLGDISTLAGSLERLGMLQPVVVNTRNELIAGRRRLEAARRLKWKEVPVRVVATLDAAVAALRAELEENTCREPLVITDAVALADRIAALEKPAAKQRQREHGGTAPGKGKNTGGNFPPVSSDPGKTRDKAAAAVGLSGKTYEKAKRVLDAAAADPAKYGDLKERLERPGAKVDPVYREYQRRADPAKAAERDAKKAAKKDTPTPEAPGPSDPAPEPAPQPAPEEAGPATVDVAYGGPADCKRALDRLVQGVKKLRAGISCVIGSTYGDEVKGVFAAHAATTLHRTGNTVDMGSYGKVITVGPPEWSCTALDELAGQLSAASLLMGRVDARPPGRGEFVPPWESVAHLGDGEEGDVPL